MIIHWKAVLYCCFSILLLIFVILENFSILDLALSGMKELNKINIDLLMGGDVIPRIF